MRHVKGGSRMGRLGGVAQTQRKGPVRLKINEGDRTGRHLVRSGGPTAHGPEDVRNDLRYRRQRQPSATWQTGLIRAIGLAASVDALTALPAPRRPLSQVNGARIDLATACLLNSDLDSSAQALRLLLNEPLSVRNVSLAGRLVRTQTALLSPAWAKNSRARHLADDIGQWLATGQEAPLLRIAQR